MNWAYSRADRRLWTLIRRTCLGLALCCVGTAIAEPTIRNTAPAQLVTVQCTHETPLKQGVLGSPTNLVQLPNRDPGVSELAALMRRILNGLSQQKVVLDAQKSNQNPTQLPTLIDFSRISCAWPTDHSTRTPLFHAHAIAMNNTLKTHQKSQSRESYTQVVDSCLACHRHYCRGPVVAIKELYLQTLSDPGPVKPAAETCD